MYESPINKIYRDIQSQIIKQDEEHMMYAVNQAIGYTVDKEELIKALQYDREQYKKGYKDGKKETLKNVKEEIETAHIGLLKDYGFSNLIVVLEILDKLIAESET